MAHIQRLIFFVLALSFSASSFAVVPLQVNNGYKVGVLCYQAQTAVSGASQADACAAGGGAYSNASVHFVSSSVSGNTCTIQLAMNSNNASAGSCTAALAPFSSSSCPANSGMTPTPCTCNSGYVENASHTACLTNAEAVCVPLAGQTTYVSAPGRLMPGQTVCGAVGCNLTVSSTVINFTDKTTGMGVGQGDATITATPCTYSAPAAGAPTPAASAATVATPSTCKGGSVGQVNGVQICVPYDPAKNTVQSTTTSTSSSTATGPAGAASSASSSSSTTTCDGAKCTTDKTTTNTPGSGGTPTVTKDSAVVPKDEFCAKNPSDAQCKSTPSSFGGACGSAPACSGDAVMCAVAAATFASNCALTVAPTNSADINAYTTAAAQSQGDQTGAITLDVNVGPSAFDQTNLLGAAAGVPDLTFTVWNTPVTFPMTTVNLWLQRIGYVMQGVTFLLCARIVARG
jgi:hypothetical protein